MVKAAVESMQHLNRGILEAEPSLSKVLHVYTVSS